MKKILAVLLALCCLAFAALAEGDYTYYPESEIWVEPGPALRYQTGVTLQPMAVLSGGPLLLVDDQSAILDPVLAYVKAARTYQVTVYGGPGSGSEALVNKILSVN